MGTRIRALLVTAIAAAAVAGGAEAATAPPPTLTGETLRSLDDRSPGGQQIGTAEVSRECNPDGTGTITYEVTGVAAGPYPGTFRESGVFRIGEPLTSPPGAPATFTVTDFRAAFRIDSAIGTVTGQKSLPASSTSGSCTELAASALALAARYEATIVTELGTFRDSGSTTVGLSDFPFRTEFDESFVSDHDTVRPADKDQCKKGGYAAFGYRNQGQCVSDMNRAGRG